MVGVSKVREKVKPVKSTSEPVRKGPHPVNQNALRRLKRIEGQVRGIQKMIEDEIYCTDIMTQISAVRAAMKSVGMIILKRHIETCVSNAIGTGGSERSLIIEELMTALSKDNI